MQAVMMVAGKSTRTYPLTLTRPKPMLPIMNTTIVEHNLQQLYGLVDEVILIVGYKKEMLQDFLGKEWQGIKLTYCEQKEQLGTGHAVLQVEPFITGEFIVINGDDIFAHADLKNLIQLRAGAMVKHVDDPSQYGVYQVDEQNQVLDLVEKPAEFIGTLTNIGAYKFDKTIFDDLKSIPLSARGEYEITDAILSHAKRTDFFVSPISGFWLTNGYPWELLISQKVLMAELKEDIQGTVEAGAVIKGPVVIGKNTIVKAGSYIEGPVIIGENCTIGPNCFIRKNTAIGDNCVIGNAAEIKQSIVMENTRVCHFGYIGDSVIGANVNLGAGFTAANTRHDVQNVKSLVKGKLVDTGLNRLGTIVADNVKTGVNTSVLPGRKFWPNTRTMPGAVVCNDVSND